jgi:hypothetical protein
VRWCCFSAKQIEKDSAGVALENAPAVVVCGLAFLGRCISKGTLIEIKRVLGQLSPEKRGKSAFTRLTPTKTEAYTSQVQPELSGILDGAADH